MALMKIRKVSCLKFFLHGREISADNQVGTRDNFRAAGAYFGKGSGVAKGATKRGSDAMQQAAVCQQSIRPIPLGRFGASRHKADVFREQSKSFVAEENSRAFY